MTLMKEDAHPCTMQPRQTQMASKYHVVRMKDYFCKQTYSMWMAVFIASSYFYTFCGIFLSLLCGNKLVS